MTKYIMFRRRGKWYIYETYRGKFRKMIYSDVDYDRAIKLASLLGYRPPELRYGYRYTIIIGITFVNHCVYYVFYYKLTTEEKPSRITKEYAKRRAEQIFLDNAVSEVYGRRYTMTDISHLIKGMQTKVERTDEPLGENWIIDVLEVKKQVAVWRGKYRTTRCV